MNDLDKTLKTQTLQPKRTLKNDFTQGVLKGIAEKHHLRWTTRVLQKLRTKLGLSILTGALLIGGTAAASGVLSGGSVPISRPTGVVIRRATPRVTQLLTQPLPNGNHLVGFATENCQGMSMSELNATPNETMLTQQKENIYYDVPKDSPLTIDQLQSTLLAQCEENVSNNVLYSIDASLPKNRQGSISEAYTVTAISAHSITVGPDSHYKADPALTAVPMPQSLTYNRFDDNLVVYDQSTKSSFDAIHVGDDIMLITQMNFAHPSLDGTQKSQNSSGDYIENGDTKDFVVQAILKIPALTGNPELFFTGYGPYTVVNGLHVYRVIPCTTDPTGFCRANYPTPVNY